MFSKNARTKNDLSRDLEEGGYTQSAPEKVDPVFHGPIKMIYDESDVHELTPRKKDE